MKQFKAFVIKEFHHVFRDVRTMMILMGMPIIQIILFGFALSNEIQNVNVNIVASEQSEHIRQITEKLDASKYFTIADISSDSREIDRKFQQGDIDMALVFSPDYDNHLYSADGAGIQIITDASNTNSATAEVGYASNIIQDYMYSITPTASKVGIQPNIKMLYNPQMRSAYGFVPGVMGMILILICAMMTSISIVREKEIGTMELLLVSPMKPITIIIAKIIPYICVSLVNYTTILLLSVFLLDIPIAGSLITLSALSILYIIVALSLGIFISSRMETQVAAMLASGMVLLIPVLFFSGLLFPVESMPKIFQIISDIVPAKWYILGVKKIMIQGLPLIQIWKEFIVLGFMATLLLTVSLKQFKYRLR